jgi:hypothetical protein
MAQANRQGRLCQTELTRKLCWVRNKEGYGTNGGTVSYNVLSMGIYLIVANQCV